MKRNEAIKFVILRTLGNFLVLFSLYGVVMTFGPVIGYEVQFRIAQARGVHFTVVSEKVQEQPIEKEIAVVPSDSGPGFAEILAGNKEQILRPKDTQFDIIIPKIGANARVFPNVDPGDEEVFLPILKQGVAHAKGTVFPGMPGNVYLFAHSADNWWNVGRYNAIFYLLKDLSVGDEIVVFFEDRRYDYVVSQKSVVDPTDVSFLTQSHVTKQQLVLQTCWPPGTTWKRLLVIATPKSLK